MRIPEEDIQVHYTISHEDLMTFYEDYSAWWRKTPNGRRIGLSHLFFYLSLISGPLACFLLLNELTNNLGTALFTAFLAACPWSLTVPILFKRRWVQRMRRNEGFVGKHTSRLSAIGLSDRNAYMEWTIFWPHIKEIEVTSHHIMFVTSRSAGKNVVPIPRHAFANSAEANAFVERAGIYWKQAASIPEQPST